MNPLEIVGLLIGGLWFILALPLLIATVYVSGKQTFYIVTIIPRAIWRYFFPKNPNNDWM